MNMKVKNLVILAFMASITASAQSFTIHQGTKAIGYNAADVDSVSFSTQDVIYPDTVYVKDTIYVSSADTVYISSTDTVVVSNSDTVYVSPKDQRDISATWCALGTSITWYNDHPNGFTKGYETRVLEKLTFTKMYNKGVNGGTLSSAVNQVVKADYYTVEHGINDWGHSTPVGTIDDYVNNTKNGTFAATYRQLIDRIFSVNPDAKVVLCTPRKAYGFNGYLPDNCNSALNGIYLKEYAEIVRQIAIYEGFPVADFYNECGGQHNLAKLSIDVALHPNDPGFQMMANVLVKALEKIIVE